MELFRLLGEIAVDNTRAMRALDETSGKAESSGKTVEGAFSRIGSSALGIAKGLATVGATVGGALLAVTEGTREYRAQMGLLDSAFQAAGHSSEEAKTTYSALNAVMGDSDAAVEAAQHIATIADNEKEMNTLTEIGTGVFAKFGQSLPLEGLMEGIGHTSQLGEVQGSLADALEWSGITVEDFNKQLAACSDEEERQDLIMKTLKDTYGAAATQYQETNKDVMAARQAQERLTDAFSALGRVAEPIMTAIKNKVADMVTAAVPHLQNLVNKVKDVKKWVKDNKDTIDAWKAGIIAATVSVGSFLLVLKWGKIMAAAKTAILGVRGAVLLLNAAMKANLIGLVVSLVIGLVAAFVSLWKNNEGFRNFWIRMWDKIKSVCGSAVGWIKGKFGDFKSVVSSVRTTFGNIQKAIADKMDAAREKVSGVVKKIKGFFPLSVGKIFSNLKIPKISVSGGKVPYGIGGLGKMPKFDVKWNAKGGILTEPTIFGQVGNTLLGGGEAGHEAILPVDLLRGYVADAVRSETAALGKIMTEQTALLMDFLRRYMPHDVTLDSGAVVGALLPQVDIGLNDRWQHARRGNVR